MAPNTQQTRRNRTQTSTTDNSDVNIPNLVKEPNPFVANAHPLALYSESILALGVHRRNNVFSPTTLTSLPILEVTLELAIGRTTDILNYNIQTLYTASGVPVQVRTPCTVTQIASASSSVIPPSQMATTPFGQEVEEDNVDEEQSDGRDQANLDGEEACEETEEPTDPEGPAGGEPGGGGPGGPGGGGS
ncbi:hypothetical protein J3R30DRAFT_3698862 [Lentinula aciculospora]|uniref:Uncharacterized protein n=1 Tax=Lentinula aciculospora TaxID=153920 RepID=A0A9W9AKD7_9AGAR|nr:hypothetical protein J3R30DRAFT_3698862 [Lentinula aciculospora]